MGELFGVLGVSNRGLVVNQRGIAVTSHNVANVDTPGYSRQRLLVEAIPGQTRPEGSAGLGAESVGVLRINDAFIHTQLLREQAGIGSLEVQRAALEQVEAVVNEQGQAGLGGALDAYYAAWSDLASATVPGQPAEREALRGAATMLVQTIQSYDQRLRQIQAQADRSLETLVGQANALSHQIAELNDAIVAQEISSPATDLRDQRDLAMRELSGLVEVTTFELDNGAAVVMVGGGLSLVQGGSVTELVTTPDPTNPFNPAFSRITLDDPTNPVDVSGVIGGGAIGGTLAVRDSILPGAIRSLDTIAFNLSAQTNGVHQLGQGLGGSVGNFFTAFAAVEDAARALDLDPAILASTDAIAAGLGTDPGDNRNALALAALRETPVALFLPGDPPGPPSGPTRTVGDHLAAVVADIGQQSQVVARTYGNWCRKGRLIAFARHDADPQCIIEQRLTDHMRVGDDPRGRDSETAAMRDRNHLIAAAIDQDNTHHAARGRVDISRVSGSRGRSNGAHEQERRHKESQERGHDTYLMRQAYLAARKREPKITSQQDLMRSEISGYGASYRNGRDGVQRGRRLGRGR